MLNKYPFRFFFLENAGVSKPDLFEGDIILTARQRLALKLGLNLDSDGIISRGATSSRSLLWPNGVLPYAIDSTLGKYKNGKNQITIDVENTKTWYRSKKVRGKRDEASFIRK